MLIRRLRSLPLITLLFVACLLSACSGNGKKWDPEDYTVKSGDTVYSIAWRYELDTEDFAAWNGISTSHFIKPGERLHTRKPANFDANQKAAYESNIAYAPQGTAENEAPRRRSPDQDRVIARKGDTLYSLSKWYGVSVNELAQLNQLKKPYIIQPGQTIFLKPLNTKDKSVTAKTSTVTSTIKPPAQQSATISWPKSVRWQWPAKGKVVKKYNRQRNDAKGIDIAGKRGDAIVASAEGKVVYSGSGLISYGNLIIIKHNKTFLSAYAYNRKLLVKEGDIVNAGQKIAEMGDKDQPGPRLHFEIRKNGKPVDPMKYLPW